MRLRSKTMIVLAAPLWLAGMQACAGNHQPARTPGEAATVTTDTTPAQPGRPGPPLDASRWVAQWVNGVTDAQLQQRRPTLDFAGSEWRATGNAACNRYNGSYASSGNELTFGEMASTRMACVPDLSSTEMAWFRVLGETKRYQIERGILLLQSADGTTLARLQMAPVN